MFPATPSGHGDVMILGVTKVRLVGGRQRAQFDDNAGSRAQCQLPRVRSISLTLETASEAFPMRARLAAVLIALTAQTDPWLRSSPPSQEATARSHATSESTREFAHSSSLRARCEAGSWGPPTAFIDTARIHRVARYESAIEWSGGVVLVGMDIPLFVGPFHDSLLLRSGTDAASVRRRTSGGSLPLERHRAPIRPWCSYGPSRTIPRRVNSHAQSRHSDHYGRLDMTLGTDGLSLSGYLPQRTSSRWAPDRSSRLGCHDRSMRYFR